MKAGAAGGSGLYPPPPCLLSSAEVSKQSHPRTSFLGIVRKQAPLSEICPVHLSYLKMLIFISENQSLEHYFSASDRYTCSPNQLPTPCKEWWVTYRYIHLKKKKNKLNSVWSGMCLRKRPAFQSVTAQNGERCCFRTCRGVVHWLNRRAFVSFARSDCATLAKSTSYFC